jgi:Flp pilus assembly protein TadD
MDAVPAFKNGAYESAITALTSSISILPAFYPAYVLRGRSYAVLGEYEEAEADFKKAISLNPKDPSGHKNIGFLYLILGKRDAAEDALKNALKHDPQNKKIKEALTTLSRKKAEQGMMKP